jgi:hypothetical protein
MMKPSQNFNKRKSTHSEGEGERERDEKKKRIYQCATKRQHPKAQTRAVKEQPKC